jgi:hypothetical protein
MDLREEVVGGWRRQHNEELHNLYASPNFIRVIKSMVMRWVGHVECTEKMINRHKILVGKRTGRDHSEDLGVDGKISDWILWK